MFDWEVVGGFVRHVLTGLGGSAVTAGIITTDELTAVVGGAVAILGVVWSVIQKRVAARKKAEAVQVALFTPVPK